VDHDDKDYHGNDRKQKQPDHVMRPFLAEAAQLPFSDWYAAMRHMRLADMPADNAGNYQRD